MRYSSPPANWEAIQETLFLLSTPDMRESSKAGMEEPTIQHRLLYQMLEQEHVVKALRLWMHYKAYGRTTK